MNHINTSIVMYYYITIIMLHLIINMNAVLTYVVTSDVISFSSVDFNMGLSEYCRQRFVQLYFKRKIFTGTWLRFGLIICVSGFIRQVASLVS